jgi:peptidoglycan/xylan/chitin deacetylase (PgdA/CDA1 family)
MRPLIKTLTLFFFWFINNIIHRQMPVVAVLMYHSVNNDKSWKYNVSPDIFAMQLEYLQKWGNIVPLSDIVDYVSGKGVINRNTVALTFDDGYLDTYEIVFPLIQKRNMPITVFLTTNLETSGILGYFPRPTWQQLQLMQNSGLVSIQVHGHRHLNWKEIANNEPLLNNEIIFCKKEIERNLNSLANLIAYPSGHRDMRLVNYLKSNGFAAAFGITEGTLHPGDDLFKLKRIQVDSTTTFWQFKMRLSGAVDTYRKFVNLVRSYVFK